MFDLTKYLTRAVIGVVALIAITIIFGSWYTIDQRERGVVLRYGRLIGVAMPGLNFKLPWIDSVVKISLEQQIVRIRQAQFLQPRSAASRYLGQRQFPRRSNIQVDELYVDYGGINGFVDRRITPKVLEELKTVFGTYNAATAIQQRAKLNADVRAAINKAIAAGGRHLRS